MKNVRVRRAWLAIGVVSLTLVCLAYAMLWSHTPYYVRLLMVNASGAIAGDEVLLGGQVVGTVAGRPTVVGRPGDLHRAEIRVELYDQYAPLHDGTTARISWESVVGDRAVEIIPGPLDKPVLPSGSAITSNAERVELDQIVAALDPPTLKNVNSLVQQVRSAVGGRESEISKTLQTGAPAVGALGEVLKAVGQDGPALRQLIAQVRDVTSALTKRDRELAATITNLRPVTSAIAQQQKKVSDGVKELPSTLDQARRTLELVPDAVDETTPLLDDLKPATARLPSTASKLKPVVEDLRPVVAELGPTLASANRLLDRTPKLLDNADAVLPGVTKAVDGLGPAISFLRPYIPEGAGWLSNWASLFGYENPDRTNFGRAIITESGSSVTELPPGLLPPGQRQDPTPLPGSIENQPWTDANGDVSR